MTHLPMSEHVGEILEVELRDADGDRQMVRMTPQDALALLKSLAARLEEWADAPEGGDDAE